MLKKKRGLNYRNAGRANIKEQRCCWFCMALVWTDIYSCASGTDVILKQDWRCRVIGKENSRNYAIGINNLCDAFQKRQSAIPEGK